MCAFMFIYFFTKEVEQCRFVLGVVLLIFRLLVVGCFLLSALLFVIYSIIWNGYIFRCGIVNHEA